MSSPFAQVAQNPSPAFNPFATNNKSSASAFGFGAPSDATWSKRNKVANSDNEAKRKTPNPFADNDSNLSDGGKQKRGRGEEKKRKGGDKKTSTVNGGATQKKQLAQKSQGASGFGANAAPETSSSSQSSSEDESSQQQLPTDPHARRVYTRLRQDGINPPKWPSQPGATSSKVAMAKFREQYESYRDKVRTSLTKAGLIDDPDKRKTLQDAIEFKGICEDMCPEYEKITRITELDVVQPEKDPKTGNAITKRMVKKLARSAAGQEAPLPMDVRSVPTLRKTLDYLLKDLLRNDGNLPVLHGFLWDRTRAIRRDFTFFSSLTPEELKTQVYVLETIARFHVTSLHILSQKGVTPEDFVEQQELEQLGKSLLTLRDLYDDCGDQGIECENEAEFRAYYLLFHGLDPNIMDTLQRQWKPRLWRDSDEVRTAVSLVEALQNTTDFHGPLKGAPSLAASSAHLSYFRIVQDSSISYTMACFAECHFPKLRRSILSAITRSLARPKETTKDVTAEVLNKFLQFDTVDEAIEFAELHDLEFETDPSDPFNAGKKRLVLHHRVQLPHPRLRHQYSRNLVESKRGKCSLPDVLRRTVFSNTEPSATEGVETESLFVSDAEVNDTTGPAKPTSDSPFSTAKSTNKGLFSNSFANGVQANANAQPPNSSAISSFSSASNQPSTLSNNSIASFSKPAEDNTPKNSFSGSSQPITSPFSTSRANNHLSAGPKGGETHGGTPNPFADKPTSTEASGPASSSLPAWSTSKTFDSASATSSFASATASTKRPSFSSLSATEQEATPASISLGASNAEQTPLGDQSKPSGQFSFPPASSPAGSFTIKPSFTSNSIANQRTNPKPTSQAGPSSAFTPQIPPVNNGTTTNAGASASSGPAASATLFPPAMRSPASTTGAIPAAPQNSMLSSTVMTAPNNEATSITPKGPPPPPEPPRDLLGDFANWFVLGDGGLMDDFRVYMVDDMLKKLYDNFVEEQEEQFRKEEYERDIAQADALRIYNLSMRYFYRWKDNAREKRLRQLRRNGREQARAFHEAQRQAEIRRQEEAARQAAENRKHKAELDRPRELMEVLRNHKVSKREAEEALLASGVLAGVGNEREAAARIVRRELNRTVSGERRNSTSRQPSPGSPHRGGSKTQALREELLRNKSVGFRRSLPSLSPQSTGSPEPSATRPSQASERWRLKAMGIVQMPDGTAMPESIAYEMLNGEKYKGMGRSSSAYGASTRRASFTGAARNGDGNVLARSTESPTSDPVQKRKRTAEDDGRALMDGNGKANAHKRVMSEAEALINELRSMRQEMEEGTTWFKSQNERLQSEVRSRDTTPWDGSI